MRKFKITVNGNVYEVCVEEITDDNNDAKESYENQKNPEIQDKKRK